MTNSQIVYLHIIDDHESKKIINASIQISYYVIKNSAKTNNSKTTVLYKLISGLKLEGKNKIIIDKNYSIPLAAHSIFDKIKNKILNNNVKNEIFKYNKKTTFLEKEFNTFDLSDTKIFKNEKITPIITNYREKEGYTINFVKNENAPDNTKLKKLIIPNKRDAKGAFIDKHGKFGLNHKTSTYYIYNKEYKNIHYKLIKKFLQSKLGHIICYSIKYSQGFINPDMFYYVPTGFLLEEINTKQNNSLSFKEAIYKYFEFTESEINTIETNGKLLS